MSLETQPLAERCRPQLAEDLVGQSDFWGEGKSLYNLAKKDAFYSLIFWGPPGVGKTSLAKILASQSQRKIIFLSAVNAGVKDLREVIERSEEAATRGDKALLLFLDEIHRLNKSQQDVLLPALESASIRFIGATSENPSYEVNRAILSRSLCFRFTPLAENNLEQIIDRAFDFLCQEKSWKNLRLDAEVRSYIARAAGGDARKALNLLESICEIVIDDLDSSTIELKHIEKLQNLIGSRYDKKSNDHYDTISAFIKSVRASHPDASLHYLARMLASGEDPAFIARRLLILASEDIGNANPTALLIATAAVQAAEMLGMPEARIPLAQATTYLCCSPKSNRAYVAINDALSDVSKVSASEVPDHLRNAVTKFNKEAGIGENYAYAHTQREAAKKLEYMPPGFIGKKYYHPSDEGAEKQLKDILQKLRPYT